MTEITPQQMIEWCDNYLAVYESLGMDTSMALAIRQFIANGHDCDHSHSLQDKQEVRDAALEDAAQIIDQNSDGHSPYGRVLVKRTDGDQRGLGYARCIRSLKGKP